MRLIFWRAQNKVQEPVKLRRLIADLIERKQWVMVGVDVKGDAYEGLLEKNASRTPSREVPTKVVFERELDDPEWEAKRQATLRRLWDDVPRILSVLLQAARGERQTSRAETLAIEDSLIRVGITTTPTQPKN